MIDLITRLQHEPNDDIRSKVPTYVVVRPPRSVWVPWALVRVHMAIVVVDGNGHSLGVVEWCGQVD